MYLIFPYISTNRPTMLHSHLLHLRQGQERLHQTSKSVSLLPQLTPHPPTDYASTQEELEVYVKVTNQKEVDEVLRSNLGIAWEALKQEFNKDGKVEFREFMIFNAEYPYMFYPAYRLQLKMIERTMGQ